MAKRINVSFEELTKLADYIHEFIQNIDCDCTELKLAFNKLHGTLDHETSDAFHLYIKNIENVLLEKKDTLNELESQIRQYAGFVALLNKSVKKNSPTTHKNTPKEKLAGVALSAAMEVHSQAIDSGMETTKGYVLKKAVSGAVSVLGNILGADMAYTDEKQVEEMMDNIFGGIDRHLATDHSNRINRSPSPVPQEQIDSHTLIIDDPDNPWENN